MKRFKRGLVVGKFSPLHLGHEHLLQRASDECAELMVISYSKPEYPGCETHKREQWLAARFPKARCLVVSDLALPSWGDRAGARTSLPENDAPAVEHRRFCGFLCAEILGVEIDAVYSSETYGPGFAAELTNYYRERGRTSRAIQSVVVDLIRAAVPISGAQLRENIHGLKHWVSPEVYASFVRRVCLLGGESSGKSTLAMALATRFKTQYAAEYGRELWEKKNGQLTYHDLLHIAEEQVAREERLAGKAAQFLFCDTSPLTTLYYCLDTFGRAPPELEKLADRAYGLVVLCAPDFSFVQDGTRRDAEFRAAQDRWYRSQLATRGMHFFSATGTVEQRIEGISRAMCGGT